MSVEKRFEYATADDPVLNYCLWPYPAPAPAEDKFRSVNLLYQSFAEARVDERAFAVVDAVRDEIGPFRTVFGIKWIDGQLGWEFYFYDYRRRQRDVSISRVQRAIAPYMPSPVQANENLPYFMFSLDMNDAILTGRSMLDVVHMYVGNPGSAVSSGVSYAIRPQETRLENFYFFFDAASQMDAVAKKVASSAVFDERAVPLEAVMIPQLRTCRTICVANKQMNDCIYFSGVDVDQLTWFLARLAYPETIQRFVAQHRLVLNHLLFDVGIDYRVVDGRLQIIKSGYYGVF